MYILGISSLDHDSAACLLKDGEMIAAAQEERFTRRKHDNSFPSNAIQWCLEHAGINIAELGLVAFYGQIPGLAKEKLGFKGEVLSFSCQECDAAGAFYPSPFSEAAVLTIGSASFGVGKDNQIKIFDSLSFPDSLGLLYSAFTYYTGFKVNSGEYKVMGLAPYGQPKYVDLILSKVLDLKADGSFRLISRDFEQLFGGPPRTPETQITQKDMDIACSIQAVTEEIMLRLARHVHKVTGQDKLCLGGAMALNCAANGRILRDGCFREVWIQPASGNAAGAIGASFLGWHRHLGKKRQADNKHDRQKGSLLGPSFSDEYIEGFLKKKNIPYKKLPYSDIPQAAADLIAQGKVIGWFEGALEFGPRALGARSILGDARNKEMRSRMNSKVKFREPFRPFAPTVLWEHVSEYFELSVESPYMLFVATVKEEARSKIPAVTHFDNSARVQTIKREAHPLYYDTINAFYKKTGCPVVINTSFNVRGEPLVCSPEDAVGCFMRAEMDYLVMGCFLLDKQQQEAVKGAKEWQKEFELD